MKSATNFLVSFFLSFLYVAAAVGVIGCKQSADSRNTSVKFQQYYVQGQQLYLQHCSNCHQKDGTGLGRVYPPLSKSDYMSNNLEDVLCLMRHGKKGEIVVNGTSYVQPMPGIPTLTDLEIAEIATYIYNTWEHDRGIIEVKDVSAVLANCR